MEIKITTLNETEKLAEILANLIEPKFLITLNGDLAAGKTTFTKYLAKHLGIEDTINSPTFNILKEYNFSKGTLYHIDAYRLEGSEEDLGFEDIFYDENSVSVVEWGEFIGDFLPNERLDMTINLVGIDRVVRFKAIGTYYENILKELVKKW